MRSGVRIVEGMEVLTSDGESLGQIKAILPDGRYFQIDCRLAPDYYVPVDAVTLTDTESVHLRFSKTQASNMGWEARPE